MIDKIEAELARLSATDVVVSPDEEFEPDAGKLVKVELGDAYWHLYPERFLAVLKDLADDAGSEAVRVAIEEHGVLVWHGPSPEGSRDTSH